MPTIKQDVYVEVDFDLSDYESEIESEYCNGNCLKNCDSLKYELEDYVKEMEKNLYIYSEGSKSFKSYEEIYRDLKMIIEEN